MRKSQAEASRNFWSHKAVEVEQVKNSQIIAHENLKNGQINNLKNSHYLDMSIKEREQLGLSSVYNTKERENLHLRLSNADLQNKVHQSSAEKIQALTESEIWRQRSIEA